MTAVHVPAPEDAKGAGVNRPVHPAEPAQRGSRGRRRAGSSFPPLRGLLPLALLLGVWQLVGSDASPYFPRPSRWVDGLRDLWTAGTLRPAVFATLTTFAVALLAATVLGTVLGILVGAAPRADQALNPSLEFARAMPPATVVPMATLLIGYDQKMKVAVVVFAAIWPVMLNTRAGLRGLDAVLLDTGRTLHLGRLDRVRKIVIPSLLPSIFLGVRVGAPVALVITLLVELLTQIDGIGALLGTAQRSYFAGQVYGLLLVAGLFSFAVNGLVSVLEAHAFRNHPRR